MPSNFELVSTPSPTEFTIRTRVADTQINKGNLLTCNGKLDLYLPYKEFAWAVRRERVEEFGDYIYTYSEPADAGHKWFYFARPRTQKERDTPFETFWSSVQYPWPAVLEQLIILQSSFPQSTYNGSTTVTAPRYFVRRKYRPSVSLNSRIKVEQFLSEKPWPATALIHQEPIPTEVNGSYLGLDISFPKCLHPRIELPELVPGAQAILNAGTVERNSGGTPTKQIFPATNFEDWRPFVKEDQVQPQRGLWLRERVTIYPPQRIESIEN